MATGKNLLCLEEDFNPVADNYLCFPNIYTSCLEEVNMKYIYIPVLCGCGCNEIVWGGHKFIHGHNSRIFNPATGEGVGAKISRMKIGHPVSDDTKRKISEKNKGKVPWCFGKKLSDEHRKKMSELKRGKAPWNKGKIGVQIGWNKGQTLPEELKKKLSNIKKANPSPTQFKNGEQHPLWNNGSSFEPYCQKFNARLKERIRDRDNRTCQLCGEKENGSKLAVHHIHYDKPNCEPDLISLCRKCHGKIIFNKDYYEELFMNKLTSRK